MLQLPVRSCGNYSVGLLEHVKLLAYRAVHNVRAMETERQRNCFNPTVIYKFLGLFVTNLCQAQSIPRTTKIQGVAQSKILLISSTKMKGCTMLIFIWLCPTSSSAIELNHRHLNCVQKSKKNTNKWSLVFALTWRQQWKAHLPEPRLVLEEPLNTTLSAHPPSGYWAACYFGLGALLPGWHQLKWEKNKSLGSVLLFWVRLGPTQFSYANKTLDCIPPMERNTAPVD